MHGAGNDYVFVDGFREHLPQNPESVARFVSDRHQGIGADGLILICRSDVADAEMRMYNADGSVSEMCGNGIRCVAKYLYDHEIVRKSKLHIATGDGVKTLEVFVVNGVAERIRVDMGEPKLEAQCIPTNLIPDGYQPVIDVPLSIDGQQLNVTCVSMGNPHCVIFVEERNASGRFADEDIVRNLGPIIETDARFPERVNVEFVVIQSASEVYQRTWERGSGETQACGTGASAVTVAGVLTDRTNRQLTVHLLGGTLQLEWDEDTNHVFMTGPAVEVFRGELNTQF